MRKHLSPEEREGENLFGVWRRTLKSFKNVLSRRGEILTGLMRHYSLDHAGIMFVRDLIRDTLTQHLRPTQRYNSRNYSDHNTEIFGNCENEYKYF